MEPDPGRHFEACDEVETPMQAATFRRLSCKERGWEALAAGR
jgi:hypothetical protein